MFGLIDDSQGSGAGKLWGVRVCGVIVGVGAIVAVAGCALSGFIVFMTVKDHNFKGLIRSSLLLLCCLALTCALIYLCAGLFNGARLAQLGGIAWGVLLLLFCWMLAHDARRLPDPKAPDAQEMDGPLFLLFAPTGLWLIGYLSTKRVSAKFLSSRVEE